MSKKILYTIVFICIIIQVLAFLFGSPNMPEVTDMVH